MIIKLLSNQIPQYWEVVKNITIKADEIDPQHMQQYFNSLLNDLLSDKAQCIIRASKDNRTIQGVMITQIKTDILTGEKFLYIKCLYSFEMVEDSEWKKDWEFIGAFALDEKCSYISFHSRNERIWEIAKMVGFKEVTREFRLEA